jgi:S-adenosylmethionine-dependent methyltransferase
MTASNDGERFQSEADKYAAYLETPEGRLRLDQALANVQEFLPLPQATQPLMALDLGGGTGALTLRLARLGFHVTLLDSSAAMLDIAKRAAQVAGLAEMIELKHGDADQLAKLFPAAKTFDLILCHNVLEFVENPAAVLHRASVLMRDKSSLLSILVRNQAGEVLKAAIQSADLAAAKYNLTAEWGNESLYGGKVRLFTAKSLQAMLTKASLSMAALRGVRVISDYLLPQISLSAQYEKVFELERKLGRRPEFAAIARYIQCLSRRGEPVTRGSG